MAALETVVAQEPIEIALDFIGRNVRGLPALHAEALIEQRTVHALDEAVGARAAHACRAMLDVLHREQQLVGIAGALQEKQASQSPSDSPCCLAATGS